MRAPMVLAGIGLVALAPWLARAWATQAVGVAWAVLLALSPMLVYLSRTARPYAITALTSTVAIVAFERWWRGDAYRTRWAAAYVAATVLGGWLHMLSLAFTLTPFLYFGALALRDRAALARLIRLGLLTAALLAVLLLPPLVNDWFSFAAKAGQDSVSLDTVERTVLMIAGTGHAVVAIAFVAFVALGWVRWWKRDRELAGYALTLVAVGSVAICVARPNWVQYALVFARYLVPVVPLLLLLAAEGVVGLMPVRRDALRACAVAAVGVALVATGPLPAQWYAPNQFTSHQRFQFDYDDAHSPYVTQRAEGIPPFYRELARAPAGSLTVVVAPWRLESHFNPHVWYQAAHRQNVRIGLLTPLCGKRDFGEYPEGERGMRLSNATHVEALLRGQARDADFLVVHLRPWSTPPGRKLPWPDLSRCLPDIERALGRPDIPRRGDRRVRIAEIGTSLYSSVARPAPSAPRRGACWRARVVPEPRMELAERHARAPMVLEREARLEVGLRLAPQRLALAQHAERVQQRRVLRVRREPALRGLELPRGVAGAALGVQHGQIRVPVALELAHDDLRRLAIAAEREECGRAGARHLGIRAVGFRQPVPVRTQSVAASWRNAVERLARARSRAGGRPAPRRRPCA